MSPQLLYLENESWLRTVVRSRVGESDAVDDIMQNIAMALVKQRENLSDINRISAWLYQVAVKQVLMYRRTRGRRRNFENKLVAQQQVSDVAPKAEPDPVQQVLWSEQQQKVREAMANLEELDRQILMLKYTEGWTYRQLADHMGVKEDTIEYRLVKARKNLRRMLMHISEEGDFK